MQKSGLAAENIMENEEDTSRLISPEANAENSAKLSQAKAVNIMPFIYLGGEKDASDLEFLLENNIRHILNASRDSKPIPSNQASLEYCFLNMHDTVDEELAKHIPKAYEFIGEAVRGSGPLRYHYLYSQFIG